MLKKLKGYCCQFGSPSELLLKTVDDLVDGKLGPVENLNCSSSRTLLKSSEMRARRARFSRASYVHTHQDLHPFHIILCIES